MSDLLKILDLEEIDANIFRGYSPLHPRWGRVYGGQTVSQAMIASSRTIAPPFVVHSLHSYFLRPGDDNLPIVYTVEVVRDGHSFSSRRVTAAQRGRPIFIALISFHRPEHGVLEHADPMPSVLPPSSLPSLVETMREWAGDARLSPTVRAGILRSSSFPFPIDLRRVDNSSLSVRLSRQKDATQRCWMKVTGALSEHLIVHQCALAYLSDWSLLETALLPHGIHSYQNTRERSLQMASLDHTLYFHAPFRADDWLLYEMHSSRATGGRGLTRGQFFDQHGSLLVSVVQEGLIRVRVQGEPDPGAAAIGEDGEQRAGKPGKAEQREHDSDTPKPSNHFTLLPSRSSL